MPTFQPEERESIRLGCGHIVDKPSHSNMLVTCPIHNRTWRFTIKGMEHIIREETNNES